MGRWGAGATTPSEESVGRWRRGHPYPTTGPRREERPPPADGRGPPAPRPVVPGRPRLLQRERRAVRDRVRRPSRGNLLAVLGFAAGPLVWSVPEALVTAELGSALPGASGG
ncbi:hypothetical protein THAOC_31191, partial [Thalassiosira oceanica]